MNVHGHQGRRYTCHHPGPAREKKRIKQPPQETHFSTIYSMMLLYIIIYVLWFFLEKFEFSPAPLFCVVDQFHNTHSYTMILVCGDATLYMLYIIWAMIILTYFLKNTPTFFFNYWNAIFPVVYEDKFWFFPLPNIQSWHFRGREVYSATILLFF